MHNERNTIIVTNLRAAPTRSLALSRASARASLRPLYPTGTRRRGLRRDGTTIGRVCETAPAPTTNDDDGRNFFPLLASPHTPPEDRILWLRDPRQPINYALFISVSSAHRTASAVFRPPSSLTHTHTLAPNRTTLRASLSVPGHTPTPTPPSAQFFGNYHIGLAGIHPRYGTKTVVVVVVVM